MNLLLAALVNGAVLSVLNALAVWLGLRLASRRGWNAATRYVVWWAALLTVVVLPLWYLSSTLWRQPRATAGKAATDVRFVRNPSGALVSNAPFRADARLSAEALSRSAGWFPLKVADSQWPRWVLGLWALLSAFMLVRLLASYVLLRGRKMRAAGVPPHLAALVDGWKERCGCSRRTVRLAASSEVTTPMVAGFGRPSILIPKRLLEALDADEIGQIGLHEVAHLARGDDYALIVQRVLEAVFVLHPVVHCIGRALDLEREIACDDFVLKATGRARPYAACLAKVVELTGGVRGSLTAAAAVAEGRSHLSRRINMLLDSARHSGTRLLKVRMTAAIAAIAVLAGLAAQAPGMLAFAPPTVAAIQQASVIPQPPPPAPPETAVQAPAPAPQELAVQPAAPPIKISVTVQDEQHRNVPGLTAENFRVLEDGVPQKIVAISSQEMPASLGILLDSSGSMKDRLAEAQKAVGVFLALTQPATQSFLITYNSDAVVAQGFIPDAGQIQSKVVQVQPRGGTSLREAILLALQQMQAAPNPRKGLLIVSDGSPDNSSGHSANDVTAAVSAANIPIDAISFSASGSHDEPRGLAFLTQLARLSGGQHFIVAGEGPLPAAQAAAAGIARQNSYTIEYHSTNPGRDGRFRRLQVEVLPPPGMSRLKATYDAGYYPTPRDH